MEIIFFIVGFLLGIWGFSILILPLVYGFPRAIYWTAKGLLKKSAIFSYLVSPILWTVIFVSLFFILSRFTPALANRFSESWGFQGGIVVGILLMIFRPLFSKSSRRDLQEDFWSFVENFIDTKHPENAEGNKFYLASQIGGRAAEFSIQKDYDYALKLFKKVIEIKNDYVDAHVGMAMIYQYKGDIVEAIKILENAPQDMKLGDQVIKDGRLDIFKTLGMLYAMKGEKEKAVNSLENALITLKNPQILKQLEIHKRANQISGGKLYEGLEDFLNVADWGKQIQDMIEELKLDNSKFTND